MHVKAVDKPVLSFLFSRVSPVMHHLKAIPQPCETQQRLRALIDMYDAHAVWYKHFRNKDEIAMFI